MTIQSEEPKQAPARTYKAANGLKASKSLSNVTTSRKTNIPVSIGGARNEAKVNSIPKQITSNASNNAAQRDTDQSESTLNAQNSKGKANSNVPIEAPVHLSNGPSNHKGANSNTSQANLAAKSKNSEQPATTSKLPVYQYSNNQQASQQANVAPNSTTHQNLTNDHKKPSTEANDGAHVETRETNHVSKELPTHVNSNQIIEQQQQPNKGAKVTVKQKKRSRMANADGTEGGPRLGRSLSTSSAGGGVYVSSRSSSASSHSVAAMDAIEKTDTLHDLIIAVKRQLKYIENGHSVDSLYQFLNSNVKYSSYRNLNLDSLKSFRNKPAQQLSKNGSELAFYKNMEPAHSQANSQLQFVHSNANGSTPIQAGRSLSQLKATHSNSNTSMSFQYDINGRPLKNVEKPVDKLFKNMELLKRILGIVQRELIFEVLQQELPLMPEDNYFGGNDDLYDSKNSNAFDLARRPSDLTVQIIEVNALNNQSRPFSRSLSNLHQSSLAVGDMSKPKQQQQQQPFNGNKTYSKTKSIQHLNADYGKPKHRQISNSKMNAKMIQRLNKFHHRLYDLNEKLSTLVNDHTNSDIKFLSFHSRLPTKYEYYKNGEYVLRLVTDIIYKMRLSLKLCQKSYELNHALKSSVDGPRSSSVLSNYSNDGGLRHNPRTNHAFDYDDDSSELDSNLNKSFDDGVLKHVYRKKSNKPASVANNNSSDNSSSKQKQNKLPKINAQPQQQHEKQLKPQFQQSQPPVQAVKNKSKLPDDVDIGPYAMSINQQSLDYSNAKQPQPKPKKDNNGYPTLKNNQKTSQKNKLIKQDTNDSFIRETDCSSIMSDEGVSSAYFNMDSRDSNDTPHPQPVQKQTHEPSPPSKVHHEALLTPIPQPSSEKNHKPVLKELYETQENLFVEYKRIRVQLDASVEMANELKIYLQNLMQRADRCSKLEEQLDADQMLIHKTQLALKQTSNGDGFEKQSSANENFKKQLQKQLDFLQYRFKLNLQDLNVEQMCAPEIGTAVADTQSKLNYLNYQINDLNKYLYQIESRLLKQQQTNSNELDQNVMYNNQSYKAAPSNNNMYPKQPPPPANMNVVKSQQHQQQQQPLKPLKQQPYTYDIQQSVFHNQPNIKNTKPLPPLSNQPTYGNHASLAYNYYK